MSPEQLNAFVSFIGILTQLGGAIALVALFALLMRSQTHRRKYFATWGRAWLALSVALGALALRSAIAWVVDPRLVAAGAPGAWVVLLIYQYGKLLFLSLLVVATLSYALGICSRRITVGAVVAAALYAVGSVWAADAQMGVVSWQSPVAVGCFGFCATLLLGRIAPSRRTLGTRTTGGIFVAAAVLWAMYFVAFGLRGMLTPGVENALAFVVRFNAYLDLLVNISLGFGMVLVLMEDSKREVDDAHAELAVAHDRLRRVSLYDSLTGSLNRRAFAEGVGLETAKGSFGTVALLDVDNLKPVNDGYGHRAGDAVLQSLAETLRSELQPAERLYRWGGDEFLLVLPGCRAADARRRLAGALERCAPVVVDGVDEALQVAASLGVSDYASAEGMGESIERADASMYAQKAQRRLERERSDPMAAVA